MAESESALLQRFVAGSDGEAFSEIVRRFAGPVYATCLRILADADQAADATQETFFQLVRKAHEVRGSLGGWLHRVATRKAVDLIRTNSIRRRREDGYVAGEARAGQTWSEVAPYVDEALNSLDDSTRELLIRHYLEGRSMTNLAEESGVSRPTVSRQLDSGLTRLRAHLRRRGILAAAATVSALLAESTARSAPAAVLQQLSRMALVGAGTVGPMAGPVAAVAGGVLAAANTKVITAVVAAVVIGAGLVAYETFSSKPPNTSGPAAPVSPRSGDSHDDRAKTAVDETAPPTAEAQTIAEESTPVTKPDQKPSGAPSVGSQAAADDGPDAPEIQATKDSSFQLDLSSPEATVRSFAKAWVRGDPESILACWLPTAGDYEDIRRGAYADPNSNDPQERQWAEGKRFFQSLDPEADMPILSTKQTEDGGTAVTVRLTQKKEATMGGQTLPAGTTHDVEMTLRRSGNSWLIDNM